MRSGPGQRAWVWVSMKALVRVLIAIVIVAPGASVASAERFPPPMRLGVNTPRVTLDAADRAVGFPAPNGTSSQRICRSWRAMADRLGETFLGARMRRAVLPSACPIEGADPVVRWTWPWDGDGLAGNLPPTIRTTAGAWSIRCGTVGPRERCVLAQSGSIAEPANGRALVFTTHFVIDSVSSKERLIWRLYLHDADSRRPGQIDWHRSQGRVELSVGDLTRVASFSVCSRTGCMLEGDVQSGAEIAKRLWDGERATVTVVPPSLEAEGRAFHGEVVATGLKQALPQLSRLRQRELIPRSSPTVSAPAGQPDLRAVGQTSITPHLGSGSAP